MRLLDWLRGAGRRTLLVAASSVITVATTGVAGLGSMASASTSHHAGAGARHAKVARLAVAGGTLPPAVVGKRYSYQFHLVGGGAASWAPLTNVPLGLALDPDTGVLSGVPEEAGTQQVVVSASRGGKHPALGSAAAVVTVRDAANGAGTIWAASSGRLAAAPAVVRRAGGSVTVPAAGVSSSLYQAAYFQAVDNPSAPQHDLVNVLLADVAAQVYAADPGASAAAVESGLAALKAAFASARNPQVPASAGAGLPAFGPTLVPQLTGALGLMALFAKSSGAGVVGPAAAAVAASVYGAYLKTSIATGAGFSTGYAGFSDRTLYDVGDDTASGFHQLVAGPAIDRAVACGQANAACATVENSLLTPVIHAGLGTTAAVSVTQTPAQLQVADPTLVTTLSAQGLNVTLNSDGSLTIPAGGFDQMLTAAGNLNVAVTSAAAPQVKSLLAAQGNQASPADVSGDASSDLNSILPNFNLSLTGTLFDNGLASRLSLKTSDDKPLVDGSSVAMGIIGLFKLFTNDPSDVAELTASADFVGIWVDVYTAQWGDAIKNLFGLLSAVFSPPTDEALMLAQQTQQMIQTVFNALTNDLNQVEQSIQNVETTLVDMFKAMELGFSDIDFENHLILAGLSSVEFGLGQLEYETDLTDGDVVAFGVGQIQTQIQGTINQCLDLAARQLAPLDFTGFTNCASQFKTEALTSASNDVVEFSTPAPAAPASGDLSSDGTVATTLQAHGTDPAANLSYLLSILNHWYGLGTDPASLHQPVVNPGVWSEVALGYRELLDEYPQFSAGAEPDLPAIEGPGQQIAQLTAALQQVDPANNTNAAVQDVGANYMAAFNQLTGDIATHNANFPNAPLVSYGTPDAHPWAGYDPFGGINQPVPSGNDPAQQVSSIPSCDGTGDTATLSSPQKWESGVDLPKSWFVLYNLVGYANPNLQPMANPICYSNLSDVQGPQTCVPDTGDPDGHAQICSWDETASASLEVQFMGTDGKVHTIHTFDIPAQTEHCEFFQLTQTTECPFGSITQDFQFWDNELSPNGLVDLLSSTGGATQPATRDELDSEASTILATEEAQAFKWEIGPFNDANVPDHALYVADSVDLTGALELLQLLAQTLAPSASLGDQALSDILYGQDQLPSTLSGPNNALAVFLAQQAGTGTQTLDQYVSQQKGRVTEVESLLNAFLASEQQAAAASTGAARRARPATAVRTGDLATADAPALTYSVLAQLATGARLDTDTVTVTSPGAVTNRLGAAVSRRLSAVSAAGAPITGWAATGLPPGLSINAATGVVTGKPSRAGTFTVTVTATDTVGTGVHNSGRVTFTWNITAAGCGTQLIRDGGFESGTAPWTATAGVRITGTKATPAFAGKWLARLGGRTAPRKDTLAQPVTIPAGCQAATLSFELRVITTDPPGKATDTATVQILSPTGTVLKTLATYSNKNAAATYAKVAFSLKPFIGHKITIRFASNETLKHHTTSFLIDNVALPVS